MISQTQPDKSSEVKIPRILVMRYSSLGDVALTNPFLDGLLAAFPRSLVYYATKKAYAPLVENHPAVTRVLTLDGGGPFELWRHIGEIREFGPTLAFDLHDSLRTHLAALGLKKARLFVYDKEAVKRRLLVKKLGRQDSLHTIQKYLRVLEPLGVRPRTHVPFTLHVSKKAHQGMRDFLERRKLPPSQMVVGLGPGSKWKTKQWFPDRYAELASRLVEDYRCQLIWFGSRDEAGLIDRIQARMRGTPLERGINFAEDHNLEQTMAMMGRCDLFIGNDSGLTHVASGMGCRVVVLYGSTTPSLGFEPWGPHSVVEVANLPCRPCHVHGRQSCPLKHFKCMNDMTVDLVEGAVKRSMRRSR